VEVQDIGYPELSLPEQNRKCEHGVILKVVSTNICGSDQHMVRGRTTAPAGQTLGHEITGEVIEAGRDVEFIKKGDLCSVPFNIACGRCRMCKEGKKPAFVSTSTPPVRALPMATSTWGGGRAGRPNT
jgi:glutathione-independent formaldehyde dehydrogenase